MNKKLLTILLSVLLPTFLVGAVVSATTSVGDAVSVGTTLTVAGATTLNGNVTLGNAADETLTVYAPLVWAATTTTYGIDLNAATSSTADIRLQNGETIDNATNGTIALTGKASVVPTRSGVVTATENLVYIDADEKLTGALAVGEDGGRTYVLKIDASRPDGSRIATGAGADDAGIRVSVTNYNTTSQDNYWLRGINVAATNRDAGMLGNLIGGHISVQQKANSPVATNLIALTLKVEADSANTAPTNVIGLDVEYDMVAPTGVPTISAGVRVLNNSDIAIAASDPLAGFMVDNGATDRDWQYGLYIDDDTITTADIRLSSGATISTGTGVPDATCTVGSLYIRTGQAANATLYICTVVDGTWQILSALH